MRQVVLDTETTGLSPSSGHRIIEIGCVELINRRLSGNVYHQYINPDRKVDQGAFEVHGISNDFLADKPRFADIRDDFISFIKGAELIIHNAPFDVGFINHEFKLISKSNKLVDEICSVLDTLLLARKMHPGQKNNLDALCKRYEIDNSKRDKHGALLDAEILSDVYLMMTGGQADLMFADDSRAGQIARKRSKSKVFKNIDLIPTIKANAEEKAAHLTRLDEINEVSNQQCLWLKESE